MAGVVRFGVLIVQIILAAGLIVWVATAPLAWILRDGLGPDTVGTQGAEAVGKFLAGWGLPALVLAVLLAGLNRVARRLAPREEPGGRE